MSDWHDEFTEPMHDTPADKDPLIAAMEAAGYAYDGLESTNDNLRFFGIAQTWQQVCHCSLDFSLRSFYLLVITLRCIQQ